MTTTTTKTTLHAASVRDSDSGDDDVMDRFEQARQRFKQQTQSMRPGPRGDGDANARNNNEPMAQYRPNYNSYMPSNSYYPQEEENAQDDQVRDKKMAQYGRAGPMASAASSSSAARTKFIPGYQEQRRTIREEKRRPDTGDEETTFFGEYIASIRDKLMPNFSSSNQQQQQPENVFDRDEDPYRPDFFTNTYMSSYQPEQPQQQAPPQQTTATWEERVARLRQYSPGYTPPATDYNSESTTTTTTTTAADSSSYGVSDYPQQTTATWEERMERLSQYGQSSESSNTETDTSSLYDVSDYSQGQQQQQQEEGTTSTWEERMERLSRYRPQNSPEVDAASMASERQSIMSNYAATPSQEVGIGEKKEEEEEVIIAQTQYGPDVSMASARESFMRNYAAATPDEQQQQQQQQQQENLSAEEGIAAVAQYDSSAVDQSMSAQQTTTARQQERAAKKEERASDEVTAPYVASADGDADNNMASARERFASDLSKKEQKQESSSSTTRTTKDEGMAEYDRAFSFMAATKDMSSSSSRPYTTGQQPMSAEEERATDQVIAEVEAPDESVVSMASTTLQISEEQETAPYVDAVSSSDSSSLKEESGVIVSAQNVFLEQQSSSDEQVGEEGIAQYKGGDDGVLANTVQQTTTKEEERARDAAVDPSNPSVYRASAGDGAVPKSPEQASSFNEKRDQGMAQYDIALSMASSGAPKSSEQPTTSKQDRNYGMAGNDFVASMSSPNHGSSGPQNSATQTFTTDERDQTKNDPVRVHKAELRDKFIPNYQPPKRTTEAKRDDVMAQYERAFSRAWDSFMPNDHQQQREERDETMDRNGPAENIFSSIRDRFIPNSQQQPTTMNIDRDEDMAQYGPGAPILASTDESGIPNYQQQQSPLYGRGDYGASSNDNGRGNYRQQQTSQYDGRGDYGASSNDNGMPNYQRRQMDQNGPGDYYRASSNDNGVPDFQRRQMDQNDPGDYRVSSNDNGVPDYQEQQPTEREERMAQYGGRGVSATSPTDIFMRNYQQQRRDAKADDVMSQYDRAVSMASSQDSVMRSYDEALKARSKPPMEPESTSVTPKVNKYTFWQQMASVQSLTAGAFSGIIGLGPILALHHFYWFPSYESLSQFEWDFGTSMLEGALFGLVYRYALRTDVDSTRLKNNVLIALVLIRSFVQVHVSMSCTPGIPLVCGEPLEILDWGMLQQFSLALVESLALFATVAGTMEFLLKRNLIRQFPG